MVRLNGSVYQNTTEMKDPLTVESERVCEDCSHTHRVTDCNLLSIQEPGADLFKTFLASALIQVPGVCACACVYCCLNERLWERVWVGVCLLTQCQKKTGLSLLRHT